MKKTVKDPKTTFLKRLLKHMRDTAPEWFIDPDEPSCLRRKVANKPNQEPSCPLSSLQDAPVREYDRVADEVNCPDGLREEIVKAADYPLRDLAEVPREIRKQMLEAVGLDGRGKRISAE